MTSGQGLHDHAGLRPDNEVLVHGGVGGVGGFTVQLAAQSGATVTATVRGIEDAHRRRVGGRRVIDVSGTGFDAGPAGAGRRAGVLATARCDIVLDTVGGETLERSYPLLHPGGRLETLAAPPSVDRAAAYQATAMFFIVRPDVDELWSWPNWWTAAP